ncbi:hypothetical protein [Thalassospira indica]|uniref:Uncharacterized protein n=1 Tax=Thalassospira indica TaxID=1891279 RepID=A0ABM6XWE8_9PROT|nr:hypothetical protein [Thalassospira indica]AXO13788.1 hypothetical protein DY252_05785 [Thalassospira indica]OAZ14328.1 hypothetical protein TH15_00430 [Thalassospira profundimaris]
MKNLIIKAACAALLALLGSGIMVSPALAAECAPGTAAHEYEDWKWIENNAARTADSYAAEHQPMATYIRATTEVVFLEGREGYFVYLENTSSTGAISTAILQPNFDFCDDPGKLNDSDPNLLTVVQGTYNGQPF